MTWGYLIVMAVVLVLGIALAPKPQGPRAAEIDDFDFPTAEEGRPIPVIFGEVDIRGSNVLWYGDLQVKAIKKRSGFSKSTVGHKYYIGWHMGLCHGPVDAVTNILIGEKQAWSGNITSNGDITINNENLFGGEKREGGWVGTINVCMGGPAQTANPYLSTKLSTAYPGIPVPAFRGILGLVINKAYIGTSAYPKILTVRARRILQGWQTGTAWYSAKATVDTHHMNPAHIIYQCLTDSRWGMGVDTSLIDETSFMAVADKLHAENFGMSVNWNQSESIEKFIQIILDHIAGGLTLNNSTGKYELLLVRGDYDIEDLDTYDESDIIQVIDYQRQGWGETVNEVTLVYTDPRTRKDTTISQQDLANIDAQGTRVPQIIKLKGIHNHEVAKTVLARELVSRVTPLSKVVFEINRRAWAVRYGGLFKLQYSPRNINGVVYRVLKVSKGTLQKNSIRIEALEDIYALGVNSSIGTPSDPPDDETPPNTPPDQTDTGVNVISTTTTTPPSMPADGDSYLIPGDGVASGAWAGHEGQVADWDDDDQVWIFTDVPDNTLIFDETTNTWHTVVGGVAENPPWSPAIPPLTEDTTPPLSTTHILGYDTATETYYKFPGDSIEADLRNNVTTLTSSGGAVTVDWQDGDYFDFPLTEDVTTWTFNNMPGAGRGSTIRIRFTQDSTPRSVAWPDSFLWPDGTEVFVSNSAGAVDVLTLLTFDNGTTWHPFLTRNFVSLAEPYVFIMYKSGSDYALGVGDNTVPMNVAGVDPYGGCGSNTYTIPSGAGGTWRFGITAQMHGSGNVSFRIYKNGVSAFASPAEAISSNIGRSFSAEISVAEGDVISFVLNLTSSGTGLRLGNSPAMWGYLVDPTGLYAECTATASQSVGTSSNPIDFTVEVSDTGNFFDIGSPTRFTISESGYYRIWGSWTRTGAGGLFITRSGAESITTNPEPRVFTNTASSRVDAVDILYRLNAGDFVEFHSHVGITTSNATFSIEKVASA